MSQVGAGERRLTAKEALGVALKQLGELSPDALRAELQAHQNGGLALAMRETAQFLSSFEQSPAVDSPAGLPTVARLYHTGIGRRYKRASTQPGPGEPLCFVATAKDAVRRATENEYYRCTRIAEAEALRLSAQGSSAEAEAVLQVLKLMRSKP